MIKSLSRLNAGLDLVESGSAMEDTMGRIIGKRLPQTTDATWAAVQALVLTGNGLWD